jgi:hypothetical protein
MQNQRVLGCFGVLSGLFIAACSGDGPVTRDETSTSGGSTTSAGSTNGGSTSAQCSPTSASIQATIFRASCDGAGCHGSKDAAAGLDLVDHSPDALVAASSALCNGWLLVVPGSPEKSLLYQKLTAKVPACGDPMPLAGHLSDVSTRCIGDWITQMAAASGGCETCGGTECVALASDPLHCGACNQACPAGVACINGACSCPGGTELCGSSCVDVATNAQNCGKCGSLCAAKQVCLQGKCASGCGPLMQCGTSCADVETDANNCGACGTKCGAGEACVNGACQCAASGSVSFKSDVAPILSGACTAAGCHSGNKPKENLALDVTKSYPELVNVATSECGGSRKLVVPGSPASSYLMQKLLGVSMCTGTQMPKAGQSLPQKQLDLVSGWICSGAPNN